MSRVAVIGTGGTISSLAGSSLDTIDYSEFGTKLTAAEVLARVPEAAQVAEPLAAPFRAVSSTAIAPEDWTALSDLVHATAAREPGLAGFVILHGTATLEETAFFLNLTLSVPHPVVLTGAQRPLSAVGSDAPTNLLAALAVASSPVARGIVSAGFAPGYVAPGEKAALARAMAAGVVVVQSSWVVSGQVARRRFLREHGIVPGGDFNPQKARILLMLALTRTSDPEEISAFFATH